jgi:hypothetical protein
MSWISSNSQPESFILQQKKEKQLDFPLKTSSSPEAHSSGK